MAKKKGAPVQTEIDYKYLYEESVDEMKELKIEVEELREQNADLISKLEILDQMDL